MTGCYLCVCMSDRGSYHVSNPISARKASTPVNRVHQKRAADWTDCINIWDFQPGTSRRGSIRNHFYFRFEREECQAPGSGRCEARPRSKVSLASYLITVQMGYIRLINKPTIAQYYQGHTRRHSASLSPKWLKNKSPWRS